MWETKVVDRILHNLSLLLGKPFTTVQELNKFRRDIGREISIGREMVEAAATAAGSVAGAQPVEAGA
jgi:hypothetical protein